MGILLVLIKYFIVIVVATEQHKILIIYFISNTVGVLYKHIKHYYQLVDEYDISFPVSHSSHGYPGMEMMESSQV